MNYIIYQAYGSKDIINEAIYSLLSYYKSTSDDVNNEVKIVIYADDIPAIDHYFSEKNLIYRPLTQELIMEWRGNIDFVHRVKIKILQDFFADYQEANILYVDSDTVFKTGPEQLFKSISEGKFVMHVMEGILKERANLILKKLFKYLYFNDILLKNGEKIRVSLKTQMWNAGVLGINDSNKDILDKVLDFTDSLYPKFSKHIVEQFAFSYYFQTEGEIIPAGPIIFHYWNFKEFRIVLSAFFERYKGKDLNFLLGKIDEIDPQNLIQHKLKYEKLSNGGKFMKKLFGKDWQAQLKQFDWDKEKAV